MLVFKESGVSILKKFYISLISILLLAVAVLIIGDVASLWDVSSRAEGVLGLLVILPAVIWIFFKGVNIINIGLYLGGLDYIIIKKFLGLSGSVVLIIVEAVLIIVALMIICALKNKQLSQKIDDAQESGGENIG